MAMCKAPRHRGGHAPPAGKLCEYLVNEEQRDQVWTLECQGNEIDAEAMKSQLGGYHAQHWHGIVAPSAEECQALTQRYGSLESAAKGHALKMDAELSRESKCPRPMVSIHLEHDTKGDRRFHYHFVGKGPCPVRMFGEKGRLQRAWDRAWDPDRKPILDWQAHRSFLEIRGQLQGVVREQRELNKARQRDLRGMTNPGSKQGIRDRYLPQEVELIQRRHQLERGACDARYQARSDSGSPAHRSEIQCIDARKNAALGRISGRTVGRSLQRQMAYQMGRATSAAKRTAKRVLARAVPLSIERSAHRLVGHVLGDAPGEFRAVAHRTIGISSEGFRLVRNTLKRTLRALLKLCQEIFKASVKLARLGAKATLRESARGTKVTLQVGIGLAAALPTLGGSLKAAGKESLQDAGEAVKDLSRDAMEGGKIGAQHASRSAGHAGEAALGAAGDAVRSIGTLGMSVMPRPIRHGVQAVKEAGKATLATSKDVLCLDLKGAVFNLAEGVLRTGTAAARAALPLQELPLIIRVPIQAAEMLPVIGLAVKGAHLAAKVFHGAVKEVER